MKSWLSIDQSLSCTAVTLWNDSTPIKLFLIKTGSQNSKTKTEGVTYFDLVIEQINYIIKKIDEIVVENDVETIAIESPSQGSFGSALGKLLVLYGDLKTYFENKGIGFISYNFV